MLTPPNPYHFLDWDGILTTGEVFIMFQAGIAVPCRKSFVMPRSPGGMARRLLAEAAAANGCWLEFGPSGVFALYECKPLPQRVSIRLH